MQGYHPPWSKLPIAGIPFGTDRLTSLPRTFTLDMASIPIPDTRGDLVSPIAAMCDLLRYHGKKVGSDPLTTIDPEAVRDWVYGRLNVPSLMWPLSLQTVAISLANHGEDPFVTTRRTFSEEAGQIIATPDPGGVSLGSLQCREVPHANEVLKWAIASGLPLAAGFGITESWDDAATHATGLIRCPRPGEVIRDGACVVLCGWDETDHCFRVRATDGDRWGEDGYGWMPYQYLTESRWTHEVICVIAI